MAKAMLILRVLGLIVKLIPVIEKAYAQILAVIEVNKQESKDLSGASKKLNVKKQLLKSKVSKELNNKEIEGLIETAVGVMKAAGEEQKRK